VSSSRRTCLVVASSRLTGARKVTSCSPSASCGLPAPTPSTNRPPDSSSRLAASIAMLPSPRPQTLITPVPICIRLVCTATSASSTDASWPHASATKNAA
jgi:hypothetical protein